jgi:hypothetical protein
MRSILPEEESSKRHFRQTPFSFHHNFYIAFYGGVLNIRTYRINLCHFPSVETAAADTQFKNEKAAATAHGARIAVVVIEIRSQGNSEKWGASVLPRMSANEQPLGHREAK